MMRHLLLHLRTCQNNLVGIDHYDEVTHIHVRCEGRLMLSAKQCRSMTCKSSKHDILSIDDVPLTRLIARLWTISSHSSTRFPLTSGSSIRSARGGQTLPGQGRQATCGGWEGSKRLKMGAHPSRDGRKASAGEIQSMNFPHLVSVSPDP